MKPYQTMAGVFALGNIKRTIAGVDLDGGDLIVSIIMDDEELTIRIHNAAFEDKAVGGVIGIVVNLGAGFRCACFLDQLHPLRQPHDLKLRQSLLRIPKERKHSPSPGGFLRPLQGGSPGLGIQAEEKGETHRDGEQGRDTPAKNQPLSRTLLFIPPYFFQEGFPKIFRKFVSGYFLFPQ